MHHKFSPKLRLCLTGAAIAFAVLSATIALADKVSPDRAATQQLVAQLQTDAAVVPSITRACEYAKKTLNRADDARASGDEPSAARLEALAREWAELATDAARAITVETQSEVTQAQAADAAVSVQRSRLMIGELAAHKVSLESELGQLTAAASASSSAPKPPLPHTPKAKPKPTGKTGAAKAGA